MHIAYQINYCYYCLQNIHTLVRATPMITNLIFNRQIGHSNSIGTID